MERQQLQKCSTKTPPMASCQSAHHMYKYKCPLACSRWNGMGNNSPNRMYKPHLHVHMGMRYTRAPGQIRKMCLPTLLHVSRHCPPVLVLATFIPITKISSCLTWIFLLYLMPRSRQGSYPPSGHWRHFLLQGALWHRGPDSPRRRPGPVSL